MYFKKEYLFIFLLAVVIFGGGIFISGQQKTLDMTRSEVTLLKNNVTLATSTLSNTGEISSSEISEFLTGVVTIDCSSSRGSGTLWKKDGRYSVLTNAHVAIADPESFGGICDVVVKNIKGDVKDGQSGIYAIYPEKKISWNDITDVADVEIVPNTISTCMDKPGGKCTYPPPSTLNYKISDLPFCASRAPLGSHVVVIGYPASTQIDTKPGAPDFIGAVINRAVTNGIISGYDESQHSVLPHPNYFVSAKVDSGNSGGIALSKINGVLCVLGIPTWVNVGNYEVEGIVQDINNIFYQGK